MQPYSARQLAPLLVRGLVHLTGSSVEHAFLVLGVLAFAVFALVVLWLTIRPETPRWVAIAIAGMAFWPFSFNNLAVPDLLFAALVGVLLFSLWRRWDWAAALMLLPLTLSREATALVLLCLIWAGWRRFRWVYGALAVAALAVGGAIVRHLTSGGPGNPEGLFAGVVSAGQGAVEPAANVAGVDLYTNFTPCFKQPLWTAWNGSIGPLRELGVCRLEPGPAAGHRWVRCWAASACCRCCWCGRGGGRR